MNTTEINRSAWSTKWFGIIAGPLTVVAVLVPLIALGVLRAFLWLLSHVFLRQLITNLVLLISLVTSLQVSIPAPQAVSVGILNVDNLSWGPFEYFLYGLFPPAVIAWNLSTLWFPVFQALRQRQATGRRGMGTALPVRWKAAVCDIGVYVILFIGWLIGFNINGWVWVATLLAYFSYAIGAWARRRWRSRRSRLQHLRQ